MVRPGDQVMARAGSRPTAHYCYTAVTLCPLLHTFNNIYYLQIIDMLPITTYLVNSTYILLLWNLSGDSKNIYSGVY